MLSFNVRPEPVDPLVSFANFCGCAAALLLAVGFGLGALVFAVLR